MALKLLGLLAVAIVVFFIAWIVYFVVYMIWEKRYTRGSNFFGAPLAQRRAMKQRIAWHSRRLMPLMHIIAKVFRLKELPMMSYQGVTGPNIICSKKSYIASQQYPASESDIFVATQMKCGTTWMQQIVFEILHHGQGDLSDDGYKTLYGMSPWIETDPLASVPIADAPYVSEYKKRIIKTHLPVSLCPFNKNAKYIYVVRHPSGCYGSTVDFVEFLTGPLVPKRQDLLKWFCSDRMFWGAWPEHANDWWKLSQQHDNVAFVSFEALKRDLAAEVANIAKFLQVDLSASELEQVVAKCDFEYMKSQEEYMEMSLPSIFSMAAGGKGYFKHGGGGASRLDDQAANEVVIEFCRERLQGVDAEWLEEYPELKVR